MKIFLPILFLMTSFWAQSQAPSKKPDQSSNSTNAATSYSGFSNSIYSDTCLDKKFSVVFYLIQDSSNSIVLSNPSTYSSYSLSAIINIMNAAFAPICVKFEHCKTVVIPIYPFNRWRAHAVGNNVTSTWYTDKTINIYIPDEVLSTPPDSPDFCYAYSFIKDSIKQRDAIILDKQTMILPNGIGFIGSPILHAVGHYFGLPHTFAEINPTIAVNPPPPTGCCSPAITTLEFADRNDLNNCHTHGDGFCDTDADPYPSGLSSNTYMRSPKSCGGAPGVKDGKGNFYKAPSDNFMSFYGCRCRYSTEQLNYMARFMITARKYLH